VREALQEVDDEMRKVQASVDYSSNTRYRVDDRRKELRIRERSLKSLENQRRESYEREQSERSARRESETRERLLNSCPPSKVRTYACNVDGQRIVKYFNY